MPLAKTRWQRDLSSEEYGSRVATGPVRPSQPLRDDSQDKEQVAKEILDYLLQNPETADSLTGIARWRLMEQVVQRSVEATEASLNWLIAEGYVREIRRVGSERIFQLNRDKLEDAKGFLGKPLGNGQQRS